MNGHQISKIGLDLHAIAHSGQCFRMNEIHRPCGTSYFDVVASDKFIRVEDEGDCYSFKCESEDLEFWVNYFDLNTDYRPFHQIINDSDDRFLKAASAFGRGMRILRQDYWEALVSFIISQNNNIPRIKKIVEAICMKFGKPIPYEGNIYYSFPTREIMNDVLLDDLKDVGLGYRDEYIYGVCTCAPHLLEPDRNVLMKIRGIGPKVASCVLLYGHHDLNEFPLDVWMKRIIDDVYHGEFDDSAYRGFEGYVQLLMFHYYRHLKG